MNTGVQFSLRYKVKINLISFMNAKVHQFLDGQGSCVGCVLTEIPVEHGLDRE
jgi:hypothetical protein